MRRAGISLIVLMLLGTILASAKDRFHGWWRGQVATLPVVIHIADSSAWLYSPTQTADSIPVTDVKIAGDSLALSINAIGAKYSGVMKGDHIDGTFTQGRGFHTLFYRATESDAKINRPQTPHPPYLYSVEDVTFGNDTVTLAATVTRPWLAPFGGVVLVSGSGKQNRDEEMMGHKPFAVIADYLTRSGWEVLLYDDPGVGGSHAAETHSETTAGYADDAMMALRWLRNRPELKGKPVGFIGHSEGGTIAMINAADHPYEVDFIVSLAGMATNGSDLMIRQNEMLAELSGRPLTDEQHRSVEAIFEAISRPGSYDEVASALDSIMASEQPDPALRRQALEVMSSPWYVEFVRLDPTPYLERIKCPMLALGGEWDVQVDTARNLTVIEKAVKGSRTIMYPGLNHMFQSSSSKAASFNYGAIAETISETVLRDIAEFLRQL
ncbi:MAG: alpha/beta hydrolase [Bacteroides sp.]|nr:alpha/beta hydrolase [Bacteroides sp.]MCM1413638.1 alpha/beta hydrolase [Bacteroides sp.]MCM1471145.1 alpha/beta hydrolase [Bacteroides sp.]